MNPIQPLCIHRSGYGASNSQQLFALYQRPVEAAMRQHAILLCNPFGQEAIRAHRFYKVVADRLAKNGFHVMRFDYYGTGDSGGEDDEVDFAGWIADIHAAHERLRELSGCHRTSWLGLRLGATMAALASKTLDAPLSRLLLWEPITDGAYYLNALKISHNEALQRDYGARHAIDASLAAQFSAAQGHEALGFVLTKGMCEWLERLKPSDLSTPRATFTTAFCKGGDATLAGNPNVATKPITTEIDWAANEMMNASVVPAEILEAIVTEFAEMT
jgi:uncharacterized protein